ncbi:MAG: DUF932 domain-containing protein [Magnetococcales bacterium]|nr:DUF932 domain-containing protein [Magnetococcales bacterium]
MQLTQASNQWKNRPDDERFLSITDMNNHFQRLRSRSAEKVLLNSDLRVIPNASGNGEIEIIGKNSTIPAKITHWSLGQLAQRAQAPASYIRSLPPEIASTCLNYGLQSSGVGSIGALLSVNDNMEPELRAVTGPNYGRIWNATISNAIVERFGDGITSDFRVPGEFGKDIVVTKQNTTLYASDRDMFVFLADEKNRIEIPNRRDGKNGSLARGFFVWNSEVGAATFGVASFLFDYACSNRIVWGAQGYKEFKIRHTSQAPERWIEEIHPMIKQYTNSSTMGIVTAIKSAMNMPVADPKGFLQQRFTGTLADKIMQAHFNDEHKPIETIWDVTTGITAFARSIEHQDARVGMERTAGKILEMAL